MNGLLSPEENIAFEHTSILVRPRQKPARPSRNAGLWWSRRVLPPGPLCLFHDTIYPHSRPKPASPIYGARPPWGKEGGRFVAAHAPLPFPITADFGHQITFGRPRWRARARAHALYPPP